MEIQKSMIYTLYTHYIQTFNTWMPKGHSEILTKDLNTTSKAFKKKKNEE